MFNHPTALHDQTDGDAENETQRDIDSQHIQSIVYRTDGCHLLQALIDHLRHAVLTEHLLRLLGGDHLRELTQQEPVVHIGEIEILRDGKEYAAIEEDEDGIGIAATEGDQPCTAIVAELPQAFSDEERRVQHQHHGGQSQNGIRHTYYI